MEGRAWKKIFLTVPVNAVDAVADYLAELSGKGVLLEEGEAAVQVAGYLEADGWEDQLFQIQRYMDNLVEMGIIDSASVRVDDESEEDWLAVFRSQHSPVRISDRLTVRPTWCDPTGTLEVVIDPGMAFGTGSHATTRMCLVLIDQVVGDEPPERMLDLGTGTGALAIAAAFLGVREALGVDTDPVSVTVARENVRDNGLTGRVDIEEGSIEAVHGRFDIIAANLTASLLVKLCSPICEALSASGKLIVSGIMEHELGEVLQALGNCGLKQDTVLTEDIWTAALLSRS